MKRKRYSEEQIISILKEAEGGVPLAELCRLHGTSSASFYAWRKKYGGMEVSDAKRLRELEDENRRLKKLVAEQALDNEMLKALNAKNGDARRTQGRGAVADASLLGKRASGMSIDGQRAFNASLRESSSGARGPS